MSPEVQLVVAVLPPEGIDPYKPYQIIKLL